MVKIPKRKAENWNPKVKGHMHGIKRMHMSREAEGVPAGVPKWVSAGPAGLWWQWWC